MSYTFDFNAAGNPGQVALVRNDIDDLAGAQVENPVEGTHYFLSDERIAVQLQNAREGSDDTAKPLEIRLRAASACLGTLSINQAYVLKKKKTMAEEMDGPAVSASIRADAKALLLRADALQGKRRDDEAKAQGQFSGPQSGSFELRSTF